ncbi:MAG: primosomal protein N' [Planctomycetota bacterium]
MNYADIVFPIPLDKSFLYKIPESLTALKIGARVKVPFGNVSKVGYCVGFQESSSLPAIKEISEVIDAEPLLTEPMLKLCRWIADYYYCSFGQALECALPAGVRKPPTKSARKTRQGIQADPFFETVERTEHLKLTTFQKEAFDKIIETLNQSSMVQEFKCSRVFLLHGVTGSGKTEIYLQTMAKVREAGKQTIVLVPEISLTPQTVYRFRQRFGDEVAVLHSHLTEKQRVEQWHHIRNGEVSVVIGARSAIFAPVKSLGLIVIDEEHETSFKQQNTPMYHVREVAIERAKLENAVVILGSATPSLESYYHSVHGFYHRLVLPGRIDQKPLPKVEIIDMLKEVDPKRPSQVLSKRLELNIRDEILAGNQVILFLNRRGFMTMIKCFRCGFIQRCRRCQIALAYHKQFDKAVCHYCNEKFDLPSLCPECGYTKIKLIGTGTEKVEEHLQRFWDNLELGESVTKEPIAISRMDSDAMKKRLSYKDALHSFYTGDTDVLVGTQMIAKGLDFPNVTLVGIVSADTLLYLKDFRSAERTFQLITQVAGRTGRGPKGGRVLVQTINPTHYSIIAGSRHDYEKFARQELLYRNELNYPPFRHLIRILVSSTNQEKVKESIEKLSSQIAKEMVSLIETGDMEILGPAPAPIIRIRNKYRWHLVIKIKEMAQIQKFLKETFRVPYAKGGVFVSIEADPMNLL